MRPPLHVSPVVAGIGQALSIQYNNRVYELNEAGQDVITLSLGEAFFDIPVPTFEGLSDTGLHHYSHSRGLPELRQLLAKYYEVQFEVAVDPEHEAVITAGSKAAIYMVLLAVLAPGDEVIIPEPFWLSYPAQVRLCGGTPVPIPHELSVLDLERYVTARSRVLIINNPNNPTGRVYSRAELEFLHAMADKHGLLLLVDEAYNEFVPEGTEFVSAASLDPDKEHTVTVNSMSKNYGISGWRIGYLLAHRRLVDEVLKIQQHLVTCAPTILSSYLAGRFDQLLNITRPQIQHFVELRNRTDRRLAGHGIATLPGSATFYLFASIAGSRLTSGEFADELLRKSAVSVVPGMGYGESCDRFIRVSVGSEPEERVIRGIEAIRDLIRATGGPG
ncbi:MULTISPECIES: pyridoxal phosphate-dependent aminotransferase [unclassified Streptomyces]|uniref:pyridoxal phosphate-dependent aminotransferase n=1 Tax=unclassified Streptomyces TaxID=2593676 RepID=UPI0022867D3F|nr:pyridoxal phosphate-dependent aminotransferase [Streptomyces sp. Je 1-369]WAL96806.1 pyridoxal phosphate-dependent aminotransferase [Streptomyces sp. Je 1-369]